MYSSSNGARIGRATTDYDAIDMRGFRGGVGRAAAPLPFSEERFIRKKIYKKNTEMNVQMPFSGPLFPELGSRPSLSKLSGTTPDGHRSDMPLSVNSFGETLTLAQTSVGD